MQKENWSVKSRSREAGDMDKPGVSYPAIVKTYVVVIRVSKAQEAMIDYYQVAFQD